ncbi:MAG: polysaccharide lyase family 7 protein [Lentisphaerae bacterium]|nr:MAG: polysaccharide lyase family 7 protein [Lentisphaerota bacterium]
MKIVFFPLFMVIIASLTGTAQDKVIFDSRKWKITFPVSGPGKNALEIRNPQFSRYVAFPETMPPVLRKYFHQSEEGLVFHTEYTGVTTSSATRYSRTELREMLDDTEYDWTFDQTARLHCRLKIARLAGGANKLIFMQIHGKKPVARPFIKAIWEKGRIRFLVKTGKKLMDREKKRVYANIPAGEWFTCTICINRRRLVIKLNGQVVETYTADELMRYWPAQNTYYFKAGNYLQHTYAGARATVVFSTIEVSHGEAAECDLSPHSIRQRGKESN